MNLHFAGIALLIGLSTPAAAGPVDDVLAQMDAAAKSFRSVEAKIERVSLTAVINDETVERGDMMMLRTGAGASGARMRIEFSAPNEKSVAFAGDKAEIYYPKINTVHVYDLGQHRKLVDQFLLLGFGTAGRELAKDYDISLLDKALVAGRPATGLKLTPKSKKAREQLTHAELWIANPAGYPVRQKFYWPSDDTTTITFSDVKLNPPLSESDLRLELPPDVKREHPQR